MAKFIVIDGLDGCGKATQTEILRQKLESIGKKAVKISFPNYNSDSSAAVRMYLGGEIGNNTEALNPYMCGSFYAVDRFIQYIQDWGKYFKEDDNTIVIADRYLSANIIHQGVKLKTPEERLRYARWCYEYECKLCGLPKEDVTIILTVKPEISRKLITDRYNGDESKRDIHEGNFKYLQHCYDTLSETVNAINSNSIANWININCQKENDNTIDCIDNIHSRIMKIVNEIINK